MQKDVKVAAFEDGALRLLPSEASGRELVLALTLDRLLVKMVRVPAEADAVEFAKPILQAMSPYPDDPLDVSCELVREENGARVVLATALPESSADDIGEALDSGKYNVSRIDLLKVNPNLVIDDDKPLLDMHDAFVLGQPHDPRTCANWQAGGASAMTVDEVQAFADQYGDGATLIPR